VNSRKDRRVVARAKAAEKPAMPAPAPPETQRPENTGIGLQDDPAEDAEELARIIPLKVYDAKKEAQRWW
jgi:putative transposase